MIKKSDNGITLRIIEHPRFWDGQFLVSHYFHQARLHGHHAAELASRGKGKTTLGAAMLAKRFIIGETIDNTKEVQSFVTANDRTKMMAPNQILTVFVDNIDFCAKNTQFAAHRLKSSNQEMLWKMGYKRKGSDVEYGSRNTVTGVITGVNQDKLNGSRGVLYLIEEAGDKDNYSEEQWLDVQESQAIKKAKEKRVQAYEERMKHPTMVSGAVMYDADNPPQLSTYEMLNHARQAQKMYEGAQRYYDEQNAWYQPENIANGLGYFLPPYAAGKFTKDPTLANGINFGLNMLGTGLLGKGLLLLVETI